MSFRLWGLRKASMDCPGNILKVFTDKVLVIGCKTIVLLTILTSYAVCAAHYGNGTRFIGLGYNILIGNPDGGDHSQSGIDIGIKSTRHIFKLTPDKATQLIEMDGRTHCTTHTSKSVFYDAKSYQKYLLGDFVTFGPGDSSIMPYAFTASLFFKDMAHMTKDKQDVYRDDLTVCNEGQTRYILPPTYPNLHDISPEFASAVCRLPVEYNQDAYCSFLDDWGTHVIVGVEIGTKVVNRYDRLLVELANTAIREGAGATSVVGNYMGYGTVIIMDPTQIHHIDLHNLKGGKSVATLKVGLERDPEPVSYKLATIAYFIEDSFWNNGINSETCNGQARNLSALQSNVIKALSEYPRLYGIQSPPKESLLTVALMWPEGSYGFYKPNTGCPRSPFNWLEGWSRQDAEDHHNSNYWTPNMHLAGVLQHNKPQFEFCIKNVEDTGTGYYFNWPDGDYCILKKGHCPSNFSSGWLYWDDEDSSNANGHGGTLPDGSYGSNTRMDFCCRNDGNRPMLLPVDKPFYLMRHTGKCPTVHGMNVLEEVFKMDTEDSNNHDSSSGAHPFGTWNSQSDPTLHFCYYTYSKPISQSGIFG